MSHARKLTVILWLMLVIIGAQAQDSTPEADAPSWCVTVWYPSSEAPDSHASIEANLDMIDVIYPFWYSPLPDGTLILHNDAEDADKLALWREAGIIIMPSIFSSIYDPIMTDEGRAFHVAEIVALVERMGYDGIDIDYEGFPLTTREPFNLFIEALADALHTRGKYLSVAVHGKTTDTGMWEGAAAQDWARIAAAADWLNLMTYDYTSRNEPPGPISPLPWLDDVLAYAESVTSLERVRVGLPFYGYSWMRGNPPATTVQWESVQRWVNSFSLTPERDPDSQEAIIELKARGLPRQTIYMADAVSVAHLLDGLLPSYESLGGAAVWGVGGEDPQTWAVLREHGRGACVLPPR